LLNCHDSLLRHSMFMLHLVSETAFMTHSDAGGETIEDCEEMQFSEGVMIMV